MDMTLVIQVEENGKNCRGRQRLQSLRHIYEDVQIFVNEELGISIGATGEPHQTTKATDETQ